MVLWKKESDNASAHFVDLFADKSQNKEFKEWDRKLQSSDWKSQFLIYNFAPRKSNKTSDFFRFKGNKYFNIHQWVEAMEMYSVSLCFAERETNNVSFAYANRATCFLEMGKFNECLRDIELAVQANYPHMPKLMQRKAKCEQSMKGAKTPNVFDPKLSFSPNKQFPCMADVLEIQHNEEFGRHVVAKCDIGVGQTVLIEENFISIAGGFDRVQCATCLQAMSNFIACSHCTDVMFCSEECQSRNDVHQKYCGVAINRMPSDVKYIGKSILIALIALEDVDELMNYVQDVLSKRGTQIPVAANDPKSKYGLFLNLQPAKENTLDTATIYKIFTGLLDIPVIKSKFNSVRRQRFLMHLIGEHFLIISNNSYGGPLNTVSTLRTIAIVMSLFNHACAPNLFNSSTGNAEVCITMRPIKKGEQVFVKYLCGDRTTRQRQDILLKQWNFLCKCDKCVPHCPLADRLKMKSDMWYHMLEKGIESNAYRMKSWGISDFTSLKMICETFLSLYGHLPWSEEIDVALKAYTKCLLDDFPSL